MKKGLYKRLSNYEHLSFSVRVALTNSRWDDVWMQVPECWGISDHFIKMYNPKRGSPFLRHTLYSIYQRTGMNIRLTKYHKGWRKFL